MQLHSCLPSLSYLSHHSGWLGVKSLFSICFKAANLNMFQIIPCYFQGSLCVGVGVRARTHTFTFAVLTTISSCSPIFLLCRAQLSLIQPSFHIQNFDMDLVCASHLTLRCSCFLFTSHTQGMQMPQCLSLLTPDVCWFWILSQHDRFVFS